MVNRRKEGGTYLPTGSRHHWSTDDYEKCSFQPALQPSSAVEELMKAAVPAESYILSIIFHCHLYFPVTSTASNQVGVALFPSF